MTSILQESLAAKQSKLHHLTLAEQKRQQLEEELLVKADQVRQGKLAGQELKIKNSRFTTLHEEIEKEHAELAAKNAIAFDEA